jgi:hypothetical protein
MRKARKQEVATSSSPGSEFITLELKNESHKKSRRSPEALLLLSCLPYRFNDVAKAVRLEGSL